MCCCSAPGWQLASACVRTGSLIVHLDLVYVPPAPALGQQPAAAAAGAAAAKRAAAAGDAAATAVLSPFTAVSAAYTASPFVAAKQPNCSSAVNSGSIGESSSPRDVLDGACCKIPLCKLSYASCLLLSEFRFRARPETTAARLRRIRQRSPSY